MPETEYWEFLLQKEGDRSWLPLESPDVEILEGRYRIVARSHRNDIPVEVRITHQATEEVPPKRRTQKRSQRTNADGLIVVIPFTSMKPGIWELNCSGDLMSDLMGNGWQASVQLHVVPRDSETSEDWEPDWQASREESAETSSSGVSLDNAEAASPPEDSPPEEIADSELLVELTTAWQDGETAPIAVSAVDRLRQIAEQMSDPIADEVLQDFELATEPAPIALPAHSTASVELPPLQIALTQETYVAHWGQSLTLSGHIALAADQETSTAMLSSAELKVSLRDPQSSEVLLESCELVLNQPLPAPLTFELSLPARFKPRLLLGEIALYNLAKASEAPAFLTSQSFTLTADASDLLESVSRDLAADEDALDRFASPNAESLPTSSASSTKQPNQLNLSFLNFVDIPKAPDSSSFKPIGDQPLPPRLHPLSPDGKKSLDLPSFPTSTSSVENAVADAIASDADDAIDSEPTQLELAIDSEETESQNLLSSASDEERSKSSDTLAPLAAKVSSVQSAFRALKLQDRFFSRLNSLAIDAALSEELKANVEASTPELQDTPLTEDELSESEVLATSSPEDLSVDEPDLSAQEIVVDDLEEPAHARQQSAQAVPNPLLLPEDEAVPTPTLELATEELVSGRSILVRVKLPNLLPKFCVKLWINDRQTRALLDNPRWLVDFNPNGLGDLEASTQLMVPFGSLEIQLEAITIEVSTQRESHKVVVDRSVIPPDLPDLSLDDFEA